jgi:hypothetical protein
MAASAEVQAKIDKFLHTLNDMISARRKQAKANYYFSYALMIAAILSSAIAGIGGLSGLISDARLIGALALLPGFLSLAAAVLKPQIRANVQYSSLIQLYEFRDKLEFALPETPTDKDVQEIYESFTAAQKSLDKELAALSFDWSGFAPARVNPPSADRRDRDGSNSN